MAKTVEKKVWSLKKVDLDLMYVNWRGVYVGRASECPQRSWLSEQ